MARTKAVPKQRRQASGDVAAPSSSKPAPKPRAFWKPEEKELFVSFLAKAYDFNEPDAKQRFKMRDSKSDKLASAMVDTNSALKAQWEASREVDPDNTASKAKAFDLAQCRNMVDQLIKDGERWLLTPSTAVA
jgi:hypothetical protein